MPHTVLTACVTDSRTDASSAPSHSTTAPRNTGRTRLTVTGVSPLMDRWAEGILQTLIEIAPKIRANQHDYDQMANFMLCATMGLNGFIAMGVPQDWAPHMIGHELTALHEITHGVTLAIVLPQLLRVMRQDKHDKLLQYATRVLGITEGDDEARIDEAIRGVLPLAGHSHTPFGLRRRTGYGG